jgi:hypothetical protein
MTAFSANPFIYVFSGIAVAIAVLYFSYLAIDRIGLETRSTVATVTDKQFNASGTTYNSTVAGGRTWVQSHETPETYVLALTVDREPTLGFVSKETFESLGKNDEVQVKVRRTRISQRLEVVEVNK